MAREVSGQRRSVVSELEAGEQRDEQGAGSIAEAWAVQCATASMPQSSGAQGWMARVGQADWVAQDAAGREAHVRASSSREAAAVGVPEPRCWVSAAALPVA